jgi:hypothetical protein
LNCYDILFSTGHFLTDLTSLKKTLKEDLLEKGTTNFGLGKLEQAGKQVSACTCLCEWEYVNDF